MKRSLLTDFNRVHIDHGEAVYVSLIDPGDPLVVEKEEVVLYDGEGTYVLGSVVGVYPSKFTDGAYIAHTISLGEISTSPPEGHEIKESGTTG